LRTWSLGAIGVIFMVGGDGTAGDAACKGCGGCVPSCPVGAIDLKGYTDAQLRAMIDSLLETP
jgi:heterodisulfide reductase subunit A-like polyferredoxin